MSSNVEEFYGVRLSAQVRNSLLWQYNSATNLQALIANKEAFLLNAETSFWCFYLFNYFYLGSSTSKDGTVIWSILLDYGISVSDESAGETVWGFGVDDEQFDQAPFAVGTDPSVKLPLRYVIIVLMLRYFNLTTSCTVTQVNSFMKYLCQTMLDESNKIIVVDNHDMTITYRLNFTPDIYLRFIFDNLDLLPRPSAVGVDWESVIGPYWGFGDDDEQFDQAPFFE